MTETGIIALAYFVCGMLLGSVISQFFYRLGRKHGYEVGLDDGKNRMFLTLTRVKRGAR